MTDNKTDLPYEPGPDVVYVYTVELPITQVFTGIVTSDAPEDFTKEKLLESFKEQADNAELLEFREADPEELEYFRQQIDNPTIN